MTSLISDKAKKNQRKESIRTFTKIVIRNLPPTMTEEEFIQQTEPLPNHDFYYYCMADWSLGLEATCRAYLSLRDLDDVFIFRNRFDGYVFVDSKGVEYIAIVEYAPFQGFQKKKSRNNDNKENTIESESHYQQYLEKLKKESDDLTHCGDLKTEFTLDRKVEDKITSTPLLQYLASKKEKRREEAKKRIEAKRKHREEDKQIQSQQKTLKASQIRIDEKKICQNEKNIQNKEECKMSRNKRRAERDRKRREEHEQRKKVRELHNHEQNFKLKNVNEQNSLCKNDKGIILLRKTQSDASDHNATNQDSEKELTKKKSILKSNGPNENIEQYKSEDKRISVTVENFISNFEGVNDGTSKDPSLIDKSEFSRTQILSKCNSQKIQKQHSIEERRIKNKDRPSIAIYQPKARLRISAEREIKSETLEGNNISTDSVHKHEKSQKRSSCKRVGRRSKLNLSDCGVDQKCDTRKSKSSDDRKDK